MRFARTSQLKKRINLMFKCFFFSIFFIGSISHAASTLKIACAADLEFVMQKLISEFKKTNAGTEFSENYGSSGHFVTQIKSGADFDIFFSADSKYADEIVSSHLSIDKSQSYAKGILVLCGADTIEDLTNKKYRKISIANPAHAPYGRIAVEALKASKIYDQIKNKLVLGENVSQAAQFIQLGAATTGFIAQSLALIPEMKAVTCHEVDPILYAPLFQAFVILKKSKNLELAQKFAQFILSAKAQAVFTHNGFRSLETK